MHLLFNYADRLAVVSVFLLLKKEMHLTAVQLGLLGRLSRGCMASRRHSPARLWIGYGASPRFPSDYTLESLICRATALSRTFGHLFFFRAAEGLGETAYFPASMSLLGVARNGLAPDQHLHRDNGGAFSPG